MATRQINYSAYRLHCRKCGSNLSTTQFFSNLKWIDNEKRDAWCKGCFMSCKNIDELKGYFRANRRMWSQAAWGKATDAAAAKVADVPGVKP